MKLERYHHPSDFTPGAGHSGLLAAFRGLTTERVVPTAPRPLLAVPVNP
jgi:hypothetical protein